MTSSTKSLHIGVFCDYGTTYLPDEGIGVFIYNLVRGLQGLEPPPRITLQVHPGDENKVRDLIQPWAKDVRLFPEPTSCPRGRVQRLLASDRWRRTVDNAEAGWERLQQARQRLRDRLAGCSAKLLESCLWRPGRVILAARHRPLASLFCFAWLALAIVPLLLLIWLVAILRELMFRFILPTLEFPAAQLLRAVLSQTRPIDAPTTPPDPFSADTAAAPGCDVWLVPFGRTRVQLPAPQVLVLWDLVHQHVAHTYAAEAADLTDRVFSERTRQAAVICCAAQFIRKNDLERFCPYAADRLRTFSLAPLLDLTGGPALCDGAALRRKYRIEQRFLFYPAIPRPHKNHGTLVRALGLLHREGHQPDLELVLTGKGAMPAELRRLIDEEGLQDHVHFLQAVPRAELLSLYRTAALAVVPSLYEGYGLPVLEALQNGCLLSCSDIPAFRELLDGHHDAVAFFDPRYPHSVAAAVERTLAEAPRLRGLQEAAQRALARRDWSSVAEQFQSMFREAHQRGVAC